MNRVWIKSQYNVLIAWEQKASDSQPHLEQVDDLIYADLK